MQLAGITLALRLGPEAGDAAALVIGVEVQVRPMELSMPHTKHMRELGCFSMMRSPCAACIIALTLGLGNPLHLPAPFPIGVGILARRVIGSPPWADSSA